MTPTLKPIEPKSTRWEPTADPNDIAVPGLDALAPVPDQIEQIEQLITIKLQNIDANFSKMQHIMANRILPAVKRYAVATEPVREAAKFWTTFFEQAAQIRVPTYEDYSSVHEQQEEEGSANEAELAQPDASGSTSAQSDAETTPTRSRHTFNPDGTATEDSFMPQGAISSTPATTSRYRTVQSHDIFTSQDSDLTPSWTASLESPLVRLDREIQSLTQGGEGGEVSAISYQSARYDESQEVTQRQIPPAIPEEPPTVRRLPDNDKGKGRESPQPLLQNVLRRNASFVDRSIASPRKPAISPLKVKQKTPNLKGLNPYLPPGSKPTEWKGVIDLADPSVATPRKGHSSSSTLDVTARPAITTHSTTPRYAGDDSLDVEFGMSPPITMDFARLPKLGKTPKKEAAERILQNILEVEKRDVFGGTHKPAGGPKGNGTASSASSMPTPPSLSRYHHKPLGSEASGSVADASLESMMRRVGLNLPGFGSTTAARAAVASAMSSGSTQHDSNSRQPSLSLNVLSSNTAQAPGTAASPPVPPTVMEAVETPVQPLYNMQHLQDEEFQPDMQGFEADDSMDSLDSLDDEIHNTANPSAAFLLASQRGSYDDDDDDDSFASDVGDDLGDSDNLAPVHPFARGMAVEGDSFDDDSFDDPQYEGEPEEETVFGVPPAQRLQMQQARESGQNLRMLGADLLQDTIGIGTQMVATGRVEESPTPYISAPK